MKSSNFNQHRGFTLIEMLIVVALITILASIALPAYNGYVNRGKIKTAQADLVALSLNFENEYRKKLSYGSTSSFSYSASSLPSKFTGWSPASKDFVFTASGTPSTYEVKASGSANGVANCDVTLNNVGDKAITNTCPYAGDGKWL